MHRGTASQGRVASGLPARRVRARPARSAPADAQGRNRSQPEGGALMRRLDQAGKVTRFGSLALLLLVSAGFQQGCGDKPDAKTAEGQETAGGEGAAGAGGEGGAAGGTTADGGKQAAKPSANIF